MESIFVSSVPASVISFTNMGIRIMRHLFCNPVKTPPWGTVPSEGCQPGWGHRDCQQKFAMNHTCVISVPVVCVSPTQSLKNPTIVKDDMDNLKRGASLFDKN
jgi:hypothetical protein